LPRRGGRAGVGGSEPFPWRDATASRYTGRCVARRGRDVKENWQFWLTLAWFTLTYAGLALGKLPGLRIDRTGIALVGAALVLATGGLTFDEAVLAIDFATLALLLGMMILVAFLRETGFFDRLAGWA